VLGEVKQGELVDGMLWQICWPNECNAVAGKQGRAEGGALVKTEAWQSGEGWRQ
jgi:hypothetical protein